MALSCDMRISSKKSIIGLVETALGFNLFKKYFLKNVKFVLFLINIAIIPGYHIKYKFFYCDYFFFFFKKKSQFFCNLEMNE